MSFTHIFNYLFREDFTALIIPGICDTIYMVLLTTLFSVLLGLPIGILFVTSSKGHISPKPALYKILDFAINLLRSIPFVILLIILIPLSRLILGTSIGTNATILSLSIAAAPFVARIVETSLKELEWGLIEAAQAMGATKFEIIFKVMLPEALPSLVLGLTMTIINIIGYSALAGVIGGGGLGSVAYLDGYEAFNNYALVWAVILLILMVQLIQTIGNFVANLIIKNRNK
jgi:D-methionine transport system permease protein